MIYFIDNIISPQRKKELHASNVKHLLPSEINLDKLNSQDCLVVTCELNIDIDNNEVNRSLFYGVTVVQNLRLQGFKGKVLFVSFCDLNFLLNDPNNTIIKTPGHSFRQLPIFDGNEIINEFEKIIYLDEDDLLICKHTFCNREGVLDGLLHGLDSNKNISNSFLERLRKTLQDISKLYELNIKEELSKFDKEYEVLTNANLNNAIQYINNFGNVLKNEKKVNTSLDFYDKAYLPFRVLWLDDEVTEENLLYKKIRQQDDLGLIHVRTVEDALIELENDVYEFIGGEKKLKPRPKIMVVVVDFFLTDDDNNYNQLQGYKLVKFIANHNVLIPAIITLSAMNRSVQAKLAQNYGTKVNPINKKTTNINSEVGAKEVLSDIFSLGNEKIEQINSLCTASGFENYLLSSYFQIIKSPHYEKIEEEISDIACTWIDNYLDGKANPPFSNYKGKYSVLKTNQAIFPQDLKVITSYLKKVIKSAVENPDRFTSTSKEINLINNEVTRDFINEQLNQFSINMNQSTLNGEGLLDQNNALKEININKVLPRFAIRRVVIFLVFGMKKEIDEAVYLLDNKQLNYKNQKNKKKIFNACKQSVSTGLGLTFNEFNVTLEEKKWCYNNYYPYFHSLLEDENKMKETEKSFLIKITITLKEEMNVNTLNKLVLGNVLDADYDRKSYRFQFNQIDSIEFNNFDHVKAFIVGLNNKIHQKDFKKYEKQLFHFCKLLKRILNEINGVETPNVLTFKNFVDKLSNPKSKTDERYTKSKSSENRFAEYQRLFTPWLYIKKKGHYYSQEDLLEIKNRCIQSAEITKSPQEIIKSGNKDEIQANFGYYHPFSTRKDLFFNEPYFIIAETAYMYRVSSRSFDLEKRNKSIYLGIMQHKAKINEIITLINKRKNKKDDISIEDYLDHNAYKKQLSEGYDFLDDFDFDFEEDRNFSFINIDDLNI